MKVNIISLFATILSTLFQTVLSEPPSDVQSGCFKTFQLTVNQTQNIKDDALDINTYRVCVTASEQDLKLFYIAVHFQSVYYTDPLDYVTFGTDIELLSEARKYTKTPTSSWFVVETKELLIEYHSNKGDPPTDPVTGFSAEAKLVPKDPNLCQQKITITDENIVSIDRTDENLIREKTCMIQIESVDKNFNISLSFNAIQFELKNGRCGDDYVQFSVSEDKLVGAEKFCSKPSLPEHIIEGPTLVIKYHAKLDNDGSHGFKVDVKRTRESHEASTEEQDQTTNLAQLALPNSVFYFILFSFQSST